MTGLIEDISAFKRFYCKNYVITIHCKLSSKTHDLADLHLMSNLDLSGMENANARRFAALVTKFIAASSS